MDESEVRDGADDEETEAEDGADEAGADEAGAEEAGAEEEAAEQQPGKPGPKRKPRAPLGAPLTGRQRRYLRALGHGLEPLVQLGKHGLTVTVVGAIDDALARHELVKVRLGTECPDGRDDVAEKLGPELAAHVAQTIGRTILLYRRHPQEPVIQLPKA